MKRPLSIVLLAAGAPAVAQTRLCDDFDSYDAGAPISTLPGWELWPNPPGREGFITDEFSFSEPNSLHLSQLTTDVVGRVDFDTSEPVTFRTMTYVPSSSVGLKAYIIGLEIYDGSGSPAGTTWMLHVRFDSEAGVLEAEPRGDTTPLIFDRWVEWRAEIQSGGFDLYYDGQLWAAGVTWWCGTPGCNGFDAISFYIHALDGGPGMYVDDVVVVESAIRLPPECGGMCYADCDGSGATDFFDFLCYQNLFAAADPRADATGAGASTSSISCAFKTSSAPAAAERAERNALR